LKPPPAGRLRRANPSSLAQHRIKELCLHRAPFYVRGTPGVLDSVTGPGAVDRIIDEEFAGGHRDYTKEAHVSELADDAIDLLVDFWNDMPMNGEVEIIGLGGAIGDVAEDATAFSNRQYLMWLNFAMSWDDPGDDQDYIERTRRIVGDLAPWVGNITPSEAP
jgi:hypothetical protein